MPPVVAAVGAVASAVIGATIPGIFAQVAIGLVVSFALPATGEAGAFHLAEEPV